MKPLISVVIPAYNEEKLIGKCINALNQQTFPKDKYEVLVIDNNSSDDTAKIARKAGARVIHFTKEQGFVPAKKFGVSQASAEVIAFTDADSIPDKQWLENIYLLMQEKTLMCVGGTILPTENNMFLYLLFTFYDGLARINQFFGISLIWGPNMAVRKEAFLKIGGFNEKIHAGDDWELVMRVQKMYGIRSTLYTGKLRTKTSPRKHEKLSSSIPYVCIGVINYFVIFILRRSYAVGDHPNVR